MMWWMWVVGNTCSGHEMTESVAIEVATPQLMDRLHATSSVTHCKTRLPQCMGMETQFTGNHECQCNHCDGCRLHNVWTTSTMATTANTTV